MYLIAVQKGNSQPEKFYSFKCDDIVDFINTIDEKTTVVITSIPILPNE